MVLFDPPTPLPATSRTSQALSVSPRLPSLLVPGLSPGAVWGSGAGGLHSVAEGRSPGLAGESPRGLQRPGGPRARVRGESGRQLGLRSLEGMGADLLFMSFFNTTILLWPCPFIQTTCTQDKLLVKQWKRRNKLQLQAECDLPC